MHLEGYQDVFFLITYSLGFVMLSSLAGWKNRNPLAWGLIGGLLFPVSFLWLLLEPHLCPKCKVALRTDDWKLRHCPACGSLSRRCSVTELIPV
jgi:hypothetical protein